MKRLALCLVAVATLTLGACSSNKKSETVIPSGSATIAQPTATVFARWDKSTTFDYGFGSRTTGWQQACGGDAPLGVKQDDPCVFEVMKLANAGASAVQFFQDRKHFLVTFEEHGRVDFGQSGVPWENMGRPTQFVFLNGSPDIIAVPLPDDYKKDPSYAAVLISPTAEPRNTFTPLPDFPWGEYGELVSATSDASGQRFLINYPLQGCRACKIDGYVPIAYNFDTQGKLTKTETLPFKPK